MSRLPFNQVRHQIGLLRNKDGRKQLSFLMRKPYATSGTDVTDARRMYLCPLLGSRACRMRSGSATIRWERCCTLGGEVESSELKPARQRVPLQTLRFGRKRVLTNYCILDVQSQNFADHLAVVHSRLACTQGRLKVLRSQSPKADIEKTQSWSAASQRLSSPSL